MFDHAKGQNQDVIGYRLATFSIAIWIKRPQIKGSAERLFFELALSLQAHYLCLQVVLGLLCTCAS
jgi:hypothetical protein